MTAQERVAEFVVGSSFDTLDEVTLARSKDAIVDCAGAMLSAVDAPGGQALVRALQRQGEIFAEDGVLLIGRRGLRAGAANAALHNATLAHSLELDDVAHPATAHLSSAIVPALMALLPGEPLLGRRFVLAYASGYEVAGKLGHVMPRRARGVAWHSTGIFTPIAAAMASAKALGLDAEQTCNALGIALSSAGGLRGNAGTMTKALHAGRGSSAGVMAALLATEGVTSSRDALDGPFGYVRAFGVYESQPEVPVDDVVDRLGSPWEFFTDRGIALKQYPSCGGSHPAIEAAQRLHGKVPIEDIASVYVGTSAEAPRLLIYHDPQDAMQARFSAEYCVAVALVFESVGLPAFSDELTRDPTVRSLMERTTVRVDDRVKDSMTHSAIVEVETKTGERYREYVELAKGKPSRWLSEDEIRSKFVGNVGAVFGDGNAAIMYASLRAASSEGQLEFERLAEG